MADSIRIISVVDDDHSMSRMLCRVLTSEGFAVISFASAEEFLESERAQDSDCLILDMNLPGMSGSELHQQLLKQKIDTPIVFISADADEATQRRALDDGAAGFLSKPFSLESLLSLVRSVALLTIA